MHTPIRWMQRTYFCISKVGYGPATQLTRKTLLSLCLCGLFFMFIGYFSRKLLDNFSKTIYFYSTIENTFWLTGDVRHTCAFTCEVTDCMELSSRPYVCIGMVRMYVCVHIPWCYGTMLTVYVWQLLWPCVCLFVCNILVRHDRCVHECLTLAAYNCAIWVFWIL